MKRSMQAEGLEIAGGPPEEFYRRVRADVEKWRKVAAQANIK
jgi:hypothetical protein